MVRGLSLVLVSLTVWGLGGCARHDIHLTTKTLSYVEIKGVPFHPQEAYQCGPSSLQMVADYWRKTGEDVRNVAYEAIEKTTFVPGKKGSFQPQMVAAARQLGLLVAVSRDNADLFELLNAGFPVIVLLNQGTSTIPVWHYAVVVGYDLDRQLMILRSGETERQVMKISTFYEFFARSGYWKLIAFPPTMVPAGMGEAVFMKAAFELEQTLDDAAVERAYETALKEWPDSRKVKLVAANYFFRIEQYQRAYAIYHDVVLNTPEDPVALNNMAEALYGLGAFDQALEVIQKAMRLLGREYRDELEDTRKKILRKIPSGTLH